MDNNSVVTEIDASVSLCLSKSLILKIDSSKDSIKYTALQNQITLPHDLADKVQKFFEQHPEITVSKDLQKALDDCKEWYVDDIEIIKE